MQIVSETGEHKLEAEVHVMCARSTQLLQCRGVNLQLRPRTRLRRLRSPGEVKRFANCRRRCPRCRGDKALDGLLLITKLLLSAQKRPN